MATEANLEVLSTALNYFQAMERVMVFTPAEARALPRAESRLEAAAVACGMDRDHGDLTGWAAERVAAWLVEA